jgi:hypothetical protein
MSSSHRTEAFFALSNDSRMFLWKITKGIILKERLENFNFWNCYLKLG